MLIKSIAPAMEKVAADIADHDGALAEAVAAEAVSLIVMSRLSLSLRSIRNLRAWRVRR